MFKIKFSAIGWRGVIAKDFTVGNISKIATAIGTWLLRKDPAPSVVIGYDTRFGGEMFHEAFAKTLASRGIKTYLPEHFVTSPMISLGVQKLQASCGIIITASHYPAEFNGVKIHNALGGPFTTIELKDIETLISDEPSMDLDHISWNALLSNQKIQYISLETLYLKQVHDHFDIDSFINNDKKVLIDSMHGAGQRIVNRLFPMSQLLHSEWNPTFKGLAPNPNEKNLNELCHHVENNEEYIAGIAFDGDADRVALVDHKGNYVEQNDMVLLLLHYLAGYKGLNGKVVVTNPVTTKVDTLCKKYNLPFERVTTGFQSISNILASEEVLLGAEENGGIAVGNHLNERDAIWTGLWFMEMVNETNKTIPELIKEIHQITGPYVYKKINYQLSKNESLELIESFLKNDVLYPSGKILGAEAQGQGVKLHFGEDGWAFLRPSIKTNVLRTYIQANTISDVNELDDLLKTKIKSIVNNQD